MASHFNVIDRIVATAPSQADKEAGQPIYRISIPFRIVSVWRAEEGDFDGGFEHEMRITLFPKDETAVLLEGPFLFLRDKPRHRTTIVIAGFKATQSGQLVAQSRIKRSEASEWMTQSYVVDVVVDLSSEAVPAEKASEGEDGNP